MTADNVQALYAAIASNDGMQLYLTLHAGQHSNSRVYRFHAVHQLRFRKEGGNPRDARLYISRRTMVEQIIQWIRSVIAPRSWWCVRYIGEWIWMADINCVWIAVDCDNVRWRRTSRRPGMTRSRPHAVDRLKRNSLKRRVERDPRGYRNHS